MKGYAKIKENNLFSQRSKSKREYPFLDLDFNDKTLDGSSNFSTKKPQKNEQKPNIIIGNDNDNKIKNDLFLGKSEKFDDDDDDDDDDENKKRGVEIGSVLKRNSSVSSSKTTQKNGSNLERQSSKRVIQEAVKRAFSMRRCSSVNNSDRYSRIYDRPKNVEDFKNDYVYDFGNGDDDFGRNGSMEARSMDHKKTKNGKMCVGSKVVEACKRLFSR